MSADLSQSLRHADHLACMQAACRELAELEHREAAGRGAGSPTVGGVSCAASARGSFVGQLGGVDGPDADPALHG